jgi:hypothetical protein
MRGDQRRPPGDRPSPGQLDLVVPPLSGTLVELRREDRIEPGAGPDRCDGAGCGHFSSWWSCGQAILALTGYQAPDPIATFYSQRGPTPELSSAQHRVGQRAAADMVQLQAAPGGGPAMAATEAPGGYGAHTRHGSEKEAMMDSASEAGAPITTHRLQSAGRLRSQ